nr:DUF3108 domain-containing protein [Ideonella oryzae]
MHLWVVQRVWQSRLGAGAADKPPATIDVAFVQALAPMQPPVAAAPAPPRPRRSALAAPRRAASSPEVPASAPELGASSVAAEAPGAVDVVQREPEMPAPEVNEPAPAASAAASPASAASAALAFDWPPSTRLSYTVSGSYRGPVEGAAKVEWRRQDSHYQVRVTVGVAAVVERRMLSDGELTPEGLKPHRYDQETDIPLRGTQRETVRFEGDTIALANGKTVPTMPGVQDAASQFVQLTWYFLTHPERLQPGQEVSFPLALPRRAASWRYQVLPPEPLALKVGALWAYPLKPLPGSLKPNEVAVQMWIAPTLQYLPVRITMNWRDEAMLDMVLDGAPLQAAH